MKALDLRQAPTGRGAVKIELARLARAIHLDVERITDHTYRVSGGEREHLVSLVEALECNCEDRAYRGVACAHLLACMLAEGDRDCLRSLRYWVPRPGARRLVRAA